MEFNVQNPWYKPVFLVASNCDLRRKHSLPYIYFCVGVNPNYQPTTDRQESNLQEVFQPCTSACHFPRVQPGDSPYTRTGERSYASSLSAKWAEICSLVDSFPCVWLTFRRSNASGVWTEPTHIPTLHSREPRRCSDPVPVSSEALIYCCS